MILSYLLSKNNCFYYDLENKILARKPSNSNLKPKGSDNSLYFGISSNDSIVKIMCSLFCVEKLEEINGLNFDMFSYGELINVVVNLNKEGQIQIKIMKDGTMSRILSKYSFEIMKNVDPSKILFVIDFSKKEIRIVPDLAL